MLSNILSSEVTHPLESASNQNAETQYWCKNKQQIRARQWLYFSRMSICYISAVDPKTVASGMNLFRPNFHFSLRLQTQI